MTCAKCGQREAVRGWVTFPTTNEHHLVVTEKPTGRRAGFRLCRICIAIREHIAKQTRLRIEASSQHGGRR